MFLYTQLQLFDDNMCVTRILKYPHSFLFIFLFINMHHVGQCDQTRSVTIFAKSKY